MRDLLRKVAAGGLSAATALSMLAAPVFAYTRFDQTNNADTENNIDVNATTGGNTANKNTGGDVSIRTGDASVDVSVNNTANSNVIFGRFGGGSSNYTASNSTSGGNHDYDRFDNKRFNKDYDKDRHDNKDKHDDQNKKDYDRNTHDNNDRDKDKNFGHKKTLSAWMSGRQEVPGPGDRNAYGKAVVTVNRHSNLVCYSLRVHNIKPATMAHIHAGKKGVAGPIVVHLKAPNKWGFSNGCTHVGHHLAWKLMHHPSSYYVNVHNAKYPDGALRGQLY